MGTIDDFIKNDISEHQEKNEKKKKFDDEKNRVENEYKRKRIIQARKSLLDSKKIDYGEREYSENNIPSDEYPYWDSITGKTYKINSHNLSDNEFEKLLVYLKQSNDPEYIKYIKKVDKINNGEPEVNKTTKVFLSILVVFIFIALFAIIVGIRTDNGWTTPGILGLILFSITGLSLRFIWKKKK